MYKDNSWKNNNTLRESLDSIQRKLLKSLKTIINPGEEFYDEESALDFAYEIWANSDFFMIPVDFIEDYEGALEDISSDYFNSRIANEEFKNELKALY